MSLNIIKLQVSLESPHQMWLVLLAICLVNFMFNFYIGLVNVCLPTITEFFGASVMTATWISNIYLLCLTVSVIILGRIAGMWSRKKFFMLGTIIWVCTSLSCYFATSADMLIILRGIQGFAAGFMAAVYYAILDKTFPKEKLGLAMGCLLVALSGGYAIGPLVGGYIAAYLGWQTIFLTVIPFGLLSVCVYLFTAQNPQADKDFELLEKKENYENDHPPLSKQKIWSILMDYKGAILQAIFLFTLTYALILSQQFGLSINDIILLAMALIFGGLFVWAEAKHEEPLFKFTVFRSITFSAYITGLLLNYIILYMAFFTLPFYFQKVMGVPVNVSGILISIIMFTAMFLSIIAGGLSDRIGVKPLVISASVACIIASTLIYTFQSTTSIPYIIVGLITLGFGYGLYQSPNNKMIISVVPETFKTQVSAMMTLTKNLGSVLGNCFAGLILSTAISQTALSGKLTLVGVQATEFITGLERVFLFGVICSVILLISTFDLQKYFSQPIKASIKIKNTIKSQ
ncbi:MFS transporter [Methanobacterium petrolearium]|uniref:MFS transporter n=1 Tax=Methanobacterium petrolearium TaxID=710190 RepID=UPI002474FCE2|nr:MFS transporter [Methanobacterium petrolearium]